MERRILPIILLTAFLFSTSPRVLLATDGTLMQCQSYTKKIDYYTALRRNGGSAKTMEKWKQKRNNYKNRYSDKNCKQWGSKLKNK